MACSFSASPLPRFVEEIFVLSAELDEAKEITQPQASPSRNVRSTAKKLLTPLRSNRSVPRSPDSMSAKNSACITNMDTSFTKGMDPGQLGQVQMPILSASCSEMNVSVTPELLGSPIALNRREKKVTQLPPGESFFEGESKDIPSPIKGDDFEEWDWTDAW